MAVPGPCPRSVVYRSSVGMQADEKSWLQHGDAPHHTYFVDRIRKTSSGPAGPGMKFDGIADGIAVCAVTHQEWFVVIYAPCTKSVHESVHSETPNPGSILLRSQYFRVMISAAPSSAPMQKKLMRSMCGPGYNTESINLWSDSLQRPN